jgi:hypothetical protein
MMDIEITNYGNASDAELKLITSYVGGFMSPDEEEAFERRLGEDEAFFYRVAPILKVWHTHAPARPMEFKAAGPPMSWRGVYAAAAGFAAAAGLMVAAVYMSFRHQVVPKQSMASKDPIQKGLKTTVGSHQRQASDYAPPAPRITPPGGVAVPTTSRVAAGGELPSSRSALAASIDASMAIARAIADSVPAWKKNRSGSAAPTVGGAPAFSQRPSDEIGPLSATILRGNAAPRLTPPSGSPAVAPPPPPKPPLGVRIPKMWDYLIKRF